MRAEVGHAGADERGGEVQAGGVAGVAEDGDSRVTEYPILRCAKDGVLKFVLEWAIAGTRAIGQVIITQLRSVLSKSNTVLVFAATSKLFKGKYRSAMPTMCGDEVHIGVVSLLTNTGAPLNPCGLIPSRASE